MRPIVERGDPIYDSTPKADSDKLGHAQLKKTRIATSCKRHTSHSQRYTEIIYSRESVKQKTIHRINI